MKKRWPQPLLQQPLLAPTSGNRITTNCRLHRSGHFSSTAARLSTKLVVQHVQNDHVLPRQPWLTFKTAQPAIAHHHHHHHHHSPLQWPVIPSESTKLRVSTTFWRSNQVDKSTHRNQPLTASHGGSHRDDLFQRLVGNLGVVHEYQNWLRSMREDLEKGLKKRLLNGVKEWMSNWCIWRFLKR